MRCFIIILLTAMFFGNPTKNDHRRKLTDLFCEITSSPCGEMVDNASYIAAKKNLQYKDYYLFSTCLIKGRIVSVGMIGYVRIRNAATIKLISF